MNRNDLIERRHFLQTATGLITGAACGLPPFQTKVATAAPAPGTRKATAADALLRELESQGEEFLSVPRKDGEFLNLMVKATRARRVLELGTSQGYSALWLSLGLEETDGHLTTIEIEPGYVKLAREHIARAGLSHRVTFHEGDAHKIVPTLSTVFDMVLLDADKTGQMDYFNSLHPGMLAAGGLLLAHNAIRQREAMNDFLNMIDRHPEYDSVILSLTLEDGFCVSYRHRT
jgi:predicted O-methyltransferase YrrM